MILATYQPIIPGQKNKLDFKEISDHLGYYPIWCFSANNFKDFICNSILAAPNAAEMLYVFKTDKYQAIDIVKWNTYCFCDKKGEPFDLSDCFEPVSDKYCEYLVKEIPSDGIILQVNLHEAIFHTRYRSDRNDVVGAQMEQICNCLALRAAEMVENNLKNVKITGDIDLDVGKKLARWRFEKHAFELFLSSFVVGVHLPNFKFEDISGFCVELYFQKLEHLSKLLVDNYNGLELPTYERQDEILSLVSSCYKPLAPWGKRKIGRNELCPCGSGKKYKKCCIEKYRW